MLFKHTAYCREQKTPEGLDYNGRYHQSELIDAMDSFSPALREKVIALLQKLGGVA
jgi:hypothetical protein